MDEVALPLVAGWDAALTYDVLRGGDGEGAAVFVGREDLVGSLVNAIGQPDRRGTYLVSGYRGAGKTSLVIEAARRAAQVLDRQGRRLLPLVLNVSEVSASLTSADETQSRPLGIDERRLLTALLRKLRIELKDRGDELATARELVERAYFKADAAQYTQRSQAAVAASRTQTRASTWSVGVADALKLAGVVAGLAAGAVGGAAVAGTATAAMAALCVALAGVAVVSFKFSRAISSEVRQTDSDDTEWVFDNSLHQIESDLKEILAELEDADLRTMFVLEELDKVEDKEGKQLDAVIRYFKNLFTQAPALFFFLTDKEYYDLVDRKLAAARAERSYAVEHTFFTHRVFVSRPALEECLEFFEQVIDDERARSAVTAIRDTRDARSRTVADMCAVERFLRVLLLKSNNHLFDLKSEMRGYVHVSDDGSRLKFDDRTFPPREQGLAAFHFLLEQKVKLYRFGGGREHANEILRNSLSSVFADIGADELQPIRALEEEAAAQAGLRRDDRRFISEAIASLTDELERGGAIEAVSPTPQATDGLGFRWRDNPVLSFNPSPRLESHEETLRQQLLRAIRVCEQFGTNGPLAAMLARGPQADGLASVHRTTISEIGGASAPLTREQAQQRSGVVVRELASLVGEARGAHQAHLRNIGWQLETLSGTAGPNVWLARTQHDNADSRVLLVYGPEEVQPDSVRRIREQLWPAPLAAVLVDDDPEAPEPARQALEGQWRALLAGDPAPPALVTVLALGEDLAAEAVEERWGERTTDELCLARLWVEQAELSPPPPLPAWLRSGDSEVRFEALEHAVAAWLDGPSQLLGAPHGAGGDAAALVAATARLAASGERATVLLRPDDPTIKGHTTSPTTSLKGDPLGRLEVAGRLVGVRTRLPASLAGRGVLVLPRAPEWVDPARLSTLRLHDGAPALLALADFLDPIDAAQATAIYEQAAADGDADALSVLVVRRAGPDGGAAPKELIDRLVATQDWRAVGWAGRQLGGTRDGGVLLEAAAHGGDLDSVAELVVRSARSVDPDAPQWEQLLLRSRDSMRIQEVATRLESIDPQRALVLHLQAAELGSVRAMFDSLVNPGTSPEARRTNLDRLLERDERPLLNDAARALEEIDKELAAEIRERLAARPAAR